MGGEIPPLIFYMQEYPTKYLFYSKKLNKYSNSLNDFKGYHTVSKDIIKLFLDSSYKPILNTSSFKYKDKLFNRFLLTGVNNLNPIKISYLEDVKLITEFKYDYYESNLTDFDLYKTLSQEILDKEILKLKNQNNLLFLSEGLDSCWLAYTFLKNNIEFKAIHICSKNDDREFLVNHSKKFGYSLDIVYSENLDVLSVRDKFIKYNPTLNLWGALCDYYIGAVLLLPEYNLYSNVVVGFNNEVSMGQIGNIAYTFLNKNQITEFNKKYGKYYKINYNKEKELLCKIEYPTYYSYFYERTLSLRPIDKLSYISNKNILAIFNNIDLINLSLQLSKEALIKNLYKLTQLEILEEEGFWHNIIVQSSDYYGGMIELTNSPQREYYGFDTNFSYPHLIDFIDWYNYFVEGESPTNYREDKKYYLDKIKNLSMMSDLYG